MVAINDRVKETTTSTGTGTINLDGAAVGFESFVAGIGNGNVTYYCIAEQGAANFEIGIGTVTCLLYTSPSPRDRTRSRMPSSA